VSGTVSLTRGTFYNGDRTSLEFSGGRFNLGSQLSVEPGTSINRVDLREGRFTTSTVSTRATFTLTPAMFVSGLSQYNSISRTLSSNLRLRWEYQPGSELFLVYTDERDTLRHGMPELRNRAFVVKVNRLLRF
jgi:hypothetical protein